MVHSPPLMLVEGGGKKKCGKNKKDATGMIRSPPPLTDMNPLSSSIFDREYFPTNKRRNHENVARNKSSGSLLCDGNINSKQSSRVGQQHNNKSIAFSDLIPEHSPFVRTDKSPRKVGLTPRLHPRARDDPQYNNLGGARNNNYFSEQVSFSSTLFEEEPTSPRPQHESSSPQLSSFIADFSQRKEDQETGEEEEQTKFDDFALTPTCLYDRDDEEGDAADHHSRRRPQSVPIKRYHRSPHWSGRVNINPFSPVPEQYLNPPSSMSPTLPESQGVSLPADYGASHNYSPTQQRTKRAKLGTSLLKPRVANAIASKATGDAMSPTKKRKANGDAIQDKTNDEMAQHKSGSKRNCLTNQHSRYLDDFEEIQFLGSGSFGAVCACLSRLDGCMYAVKSISPDGHVPVPRRSSDYGGRNIITTTLVPPTPRRDGVPTSARRHKAQSRISPNNDAESSPQMVLRGSRHWNESALNIMLREVFALAALCNQSDFRTFHIVRYHQAWLEDDGTLYIQTELCKSTLRDEMNSRKRMDVSRQFKILREILLALQLVHDQGCVHLDIKADNIFVKDDMFKLGDFGTATLRDEINAKTGKAMDVEEGDSRYMPRDLLESTPEDLTKCDIFSLGITLYETCIGRPLPLCGQDWQDLRDGKFSKPFDINPTLYLIIKQMMHPDPFKRPSASELLTRSELKANSDNVFLSSANTTSLKGTRKRSFSL